ncbi:MAG: hypothetical protein ACJ0J2_01990 [Dehalococcoidia bacterium]
MERSPVGYLQYQRPNNSFASRFDSLAEVEKTHDDLSKSSEYSQNAYGRASAASTRSMNNLYGML